MGTAMFAGAASAQRVAFRGRFRRGVAFASGFGVLSLSDIGRAFLGVRWLPLARFSAGRVAPVAARGLFQRYRRQAHRPGRPTAPLHDHRRGIEHLSGVVDRRDHVEMGSTTDEFPANRPAFECSRRHLEIVRRRRRRRLPCAEASGAWARQPASRASTAALAFTALFASWAFCSSSSSNCDLKPAVSSMSSQSNKLLV